MLLISVGFSQSELRSPRRTVAASLTEMSARNHLFLTYINYIIGCRLQSADCQCHASISIGRCKKWTILQLPTTSAVEFFLPSICKHELKCLLFTLLVSGRFVFDSWLFYGFCFGPASVSLHMSGNISALLNRNCIHYQLLLNTLIVTDKTWMFKECSYLTLLNKP